MTMAANLAANLAGHPVGADPAVGPAAGPNPGPIPASEPGTPANRVGAPGGPIPPTPPTPSTSATALQRCLGRGAEGLLWSLERVRRALAPLTRRLFGAVPADPSAVAQAGFEAEADALLAEQRDHRASRTVHTALAVVLLLLVWASVAKLDELTRGDGKVISSRQLQVIQSLDGGVVSEILVKEGQVVEAGQLLLRIDETRATSGVRENAAQSFALLARGRRLRALAEGSAFVPPEPAQPVAADTGNPASNAGSQLGPGAASAAEQRRIVEEERRLYSSRQAELSTLLAINRQQLAQREQEFNEMQSRRASAERSLELAQQELNKTRPLLASGAVSDVDILRLDREVARFKGEVDQAGAQSARVQAAIGEAQRKSQETEITFRNEARKELADVMGRINALGESRVALDDKVTKAQVKSPVRGRVQRLLANTVGGVVQPGRDLVEIVPADDALVLEARVQPKDIAFIHAGQAATVKFTAYDFSVYGGLDASVENISPDTVVDDKGNAYYVVRVRTGKSQLGDKLPILPGMTAEVDVLTGRKTVMSYLLKPLLRGKAYALTER